MCFICNLSREEFEKSGIDFDLHKKSEHNLWKYVYFLVSLDSQDEDDLDGIEDYVQKCREAKSFKWVPNQRADSLEKKKGIKAADAPAKDEKEEEKAPLVKKMEVESQEEKESKSSGDESQEEEAEQEETKGKEEALRKIEDFHQSQAARIEEIGREQKRQIEDQLKLMELLESILKKAKGNGPTGFAGSVPLWSQGEEDETRKNQKEPEVNTLYINFGNDE